MLPGSVVQAEGEWPPCRHRWSRCDGHRIQRHVHMGITAFKQLGGWPVQPGELLCVPPRLWGCPVFIACRPADDADYRSTQRTCSTVPMQGRNVQERGVCDGKSVQEIGERGAGSSARWQAVGRGTSSKNESSETIAVFWRASARAAQAWVGPAKSCRRGNRFQSSPRPDSGPGSGSRSQCRFVTHPRGTWHQGRQGWCRSAGRRRPRRCPGTLSSCRCRRGRPGTRACRASLRWGRAGATAQRSRS